MYDATEVRLLGERARLEPVDGERACPSCGVRKVRTYRYFSSRVSGPTLTSYVWCANCHRYSGSTGPRPASLNLDDPLDHSEHERYENDLPSLLDRLDKFWDEGVLPQDPAR